MTSTLPDEPTLDQVRRARWGRRAGSFLLVAFIVAGAVGLFGTKTTAKAVEASGYRVEVTYPSVSRPGHAVRFQVRIHHPGGFTDPIKVRMDASYFDLFDENGFDPDPDSQTMDAEYSYYEYAAPPGDDFLISSDTRIEPARQRGEAGEVSLLDSAGAPIATVRFRTRIWP